MSNINPVAEDELARLTMRELLTRARERLGNGAAALKTRQELEAALRLGPPVSPVAAPPAPEPVKARAPAAVRPEIVVRDFFIKRR